MITKDTQLPTYEELTVQDVELSTPFLKAGSFHLGKQCEAENNVSWSSLLFWRNTNCFIIIKYAECFAYFFEIIIVCLCFTLLYIRT